MANIGNTIALIQALAPKPDPSVIEQSVSDWLGDHPEATTTVQDGSITKAKLDNNLQQAVDKVDDIVAIQTTQPTSPDNKIWIDTTNTGTGIQVPTYEELTDLKNEINSISQIISIKNTTTYNWAIFENSGTVGARTAHRSIILPCEANTTYTIKNPKGNRLVVGASSVIPYNGYTFTHYSDLTSSVSDASFTTGTGEVYLMINFWNNYTTYTDAQALEALEVYSLTAKDKNARESIESLSDSTDVRFSQIYNDAVKASSNLCDSEKYCRLGYALEQNGSIGGAGGYSDRCVFAYIPVHGLSYITLAILSNSDTGTTGRYCWYDSSGSPIQLSGESNPTIGGLKYRTKDANVLAVPANAYSIAFQVYYEHCILDTNGRPKCMLESGNVYTRYTESGSTYVGTKYTEPKNIYVCASDSAEKYRIGCDYYCNGVHDEATLQTALNACGNDGTLYLAPGKYNIDSIPLQDDGQYCALQYKTASDADVTTTHRVRIRCFDQTPVRVDGYSLIQHCATLAVSADCYSALSSSNSYSIIGVERDHTTGDRIWNGACFDISGVGIQIPGNQKKIVAFDAWYAFCIMMERCMATAIPTNAMPSAAGNEDCIGIKCTKGSNFGQASQLTTCACYGFGQGIAVSGEHYVLTNCKTIYNKYGFTFNWYGDGNAGYTHPNTLINCCSEMDFNYPYFGYNAQVSSVTLIDFNLEYRTASAALGGELAQELVPGSWRGSINYTIKTYASDGYGSTTGNNVAMPFWKTGHGANVKSHNDAQKQICTTTERNSYAPNELQRVYDSTAGKFYTYVNGSWVEG